MLWRLLIDSSINYKNKLRSKNNKVLKNLKIDYKERINERLKVIEQKSIINVIGITLAKPTYKID
jgi:hypothetical protein